MLLENVYFLLRSLLAVQHLHFMPTLDLEGNTLTRGVPLEAIRRQPRLLLAVWLVFRSFIPTISGALEKHFHRDHKIIPCIFCSGVCSRFNTCTSCPPSRETPSKDVRLLKRYGDNRGCCWRSGTCSPSFIFGSLGSICLHSTCSLVVRACRLAPTCWLGAGPYMKREGAAWVCTGVECSVGRHV